MKEEDPWSTEFESPRDEEEEEEPWKEMMGSEIEQEDERGVWACEEGISECSSPHSEADEFPEARPTGGVSCDVIEEPYRSLFPYASFNALQSACVDLLYFSDESAVVIAPTGAGKTGLFELALVRHFRGSPPLATGLAPLAVYVAPLRALCQERFDDWQPRFGLHGVRVALVTGESSHGGFAEFARAHVAVTTPEKLDGLFASDLHGVAKRTTLVLLDEVHVLRERRGVLLEALVARLRHVRCKLGDSEPRIVAVTATAAAQAEPLARWLGPAHRPAALRVFGPEFRPVPLKTVVLEFPSATTSPFQWERALDRRLWGLLRLYAKDSPALVFCGTRRRCEQCAAQLAMDGALALDAQTERREERLEMASRRGLAKGLSAVLRRGVAFYHAGLRAEDRAAIRAGLEHGTIAVVCCTSSLAMGVNLPASVVFILASALRPLQEEEEDASPSGQVDGVLVTQMAGRAGRWAQAGRREALAVLLVPRGPMKRAVEAAFSPQSLSVPSQLGTCLDEVIVREVSLQTCSNVQDLENWLKRTYWWACRGAASDDWMEPALQALKAAVSDGRLVETADFSWKATPLGRTACKHGVGSEDLAFLEAESPDCQWPSDLLKRLAAAPAMQTALGGPGLRRGEATALRTLARQLMDGPNSPFSEWGAGPLRQSSHKAHILLVAWLRADRWRAGSSELPSGWFAEMETLRAVALRLVQVAVKLYEGRRRLGNLAAALRLRRMLWARQWGARDSPLLWLPGMTGAWAKTLARAGLATPDALRTCSEATLRELGQNSLQWRLAARALPQIDVSAELQPESECFVRIQLRNPLTADPKLASVWLMAHSAGEGVLLRCVRLTDHPDWHVAVTVQEASLSLLVLSERVLDLDFAFEVDPRRGVLAASPFQMHPLATVQKLLRSPPSSSSSTSPPTSASKRQKSLPLKIQPLNRPITQEDINRFFSPRKNPSQP